jgi:predicted GNAT family N-acyltransferase
LTVVEVRTVTTADEMRDALSIRRRVFIEEQRVPEDEEIDAHDGDPAVVTDCLHVVAYVDDVPVATGRLLLDGPEAENAHIGRVAVLAERRRQGLGREVMAALQELARERGLPGITLAAQTHAIGFYETLGYVVRGAIFLDAGIEHRWMDLAF